MYKILIIENKEVRKKLRKASWGQAQITDASHLFVFCNYTTNHNQHVDDYVQLVIHTQNPSDSDGLKKYGESIKTSISNMSQEARKSWLEKQTYLALNNLLLACADRQIDSCPMEGFDQKEYNRILGLDKLGLNASVIAPVGYRSINDDTSDRKKVRKSMEDLFVIT